MDQGQFDGILGELKRIAAALEQISRENELEEPNLVKPIEDYAGFDWSSIGATVVKADPDGPTHVEFGGFLWMRRSPSNKFSPAVWYSRSAGKDEEGSVKYLRLITFKKVGEVESLPEKAAELISKPAGGNGAIAAHVDPGQAATTRGAVVRKAEKTIIEKEQPAGELKRPYSPEQLRNRLSEFQAQHTGRTASERQRGLVAMLLEICFIGEVDPIKCRHAVQEYLFGVPSLKDVFDTSILAALDWLKPVTDSGGDIKPAPVALTEARMVWRSLQKTAPVESNAQY